MPMIRKFTRYTGRYNKTQQTRNPGMRNLPRSPYHHGGAVPVRSMIDLIAYIILKPIFHNVYTGNEIDRYNFYAMAFSCRKNG